MKPGAFDYCVARTVDDALAILSEYGDDAAVLAGGQSLMPLLNLRLARPEKLLDINRVADLDGVSVNADGVRVGALVRAERLRRADPTPDLLRAAIGHIGHPQIRNRTTIGGNLAHADPSSELPCVLACTDGEVELTSERQQRWVRWDAFFQGVFTTARQPDELVTAARFRIRAGWRFHFAEMARRHGDFPIVTVTLARSDRALRLAATGVSDRPVRLAGVERAAEGRHLMPADVDELAAMAAAECEPGSDAAGSAAYRRHLVRTLFARMLHDDIDQATRSAA